MRPLVPVACFLACWLPALAVAATGGAAPPGPAESGLKGLHVSLETDQVEYRPGQALRFRLRVVNPTAAAVTLRFNTGQRFDVTVEDRNGAVIWRWAEGKLFTQALGQETVGPGESLSYTAIFKGQLAPATYRARGDIVCAEGPLSATTTVTVK